MSADITSYILSMSCADQLGVVSRSTGLLADCGAFITEISNFSDQMSKTFHLRCVFDDRQMTMPFETFKERFASLASSYGMHYTLRSKGQRPKVLIAVSHYDHCLNVLLNRWHSDTLPADIVGVVSNHETCRALTEFYGLPFHFLPITKETKLEQERQILDVMEANDVDLLVLARYMQILSDEMCSRVAGRAINIHHSFLPGFKGAKPYHQAYERGVKVIGATAHYVTADLDEGPIIVQEVRSIDHETSVQEMVSLGRDNEATALSHAVRLHCEDRVQLNGQRTVIL